MYGLNQKGIPCEQGYEISDEPILATLFTTGNGYMGVRGSFEEYASQRVQGAFVRGYIDEIVEVCEPFADNEYMKKYYLDEEGLKRFERQESCVNMPDFLMVRVTIGQKTFFPWEGKVEKWERRLDPRTAELVRKVVWNDGEGNRTQLVFRRFASFADQNVYCQQVRVRPLNHRLPVRIVSGADTAVKTGGQFITKTELAKETDGDVFLSFRAVNKFRFGAAYCIRNRFPGGSAEETYRENGRIGASVLCDESDEYVLDKVVFVGTERDTEEPVADWVKARGAALECGYEAQFAAHLSVYRRYFAPMDVRIEGDREADGWLRFASYHTAISAPMHDSVHGISAKGLTGERYNQFVWWDAEIHQLPFFIHTAPQTAKQQLLYRYRCLPQAKENARKEGYDGAKFAFCSSVTGEERVWGYVRHPFMQVHINSDIPYGIFHYYLCTGDEAFMREYGMEIVHECVKYWLSRVTERNGRYEILRVTGTDEHHPYVDNDAYTNYCVGYVLRRFLALCAPLGHALSEEERRRIADVAERLYLPREENGMIPQFDGYFSLSRGLEEAGKGTLKQFQMKKSGLYHKSQIIKQPDVALLYTFVNVGADRSHYAANWDYYEKMCETSSSLTFPVHAVASAQNGRMLSFYDYFMDALTIDARDLHGVAWQGVHSGCLAGGYLSVLYGLFGYEAEENGIVLTPNPIPFFEKVTAHVVYRGSTVRLQLEGEKLSLSLESGSPVQARVVARGGERAVRLSRGKSVCVEDLR